MGFGTRLSWPDDYFQFQAQLAYRWYYLKNWDYLYYMRNGTSNALTLGLNLTRTSIDNPIYTRRGSTFSIDVTMTPPASLFGRKDWQGLSELASYNNKDYASREAARSEMYRWIDYYKIRFKSKTFTPLTDPDGKWTLVLMTRADFGLLGSWTKHHKTPSETFYFGGDGMTGNYTYATETISMRGYENGQFTPSGYEGYAYGKFTVELHFPFLLQPSTTIYAIAFAEAGKLLDRHPRFLSLQPQAERRRGCARLPQRARIPRHRLGVRFRQGMGKPRWKPGALRTRSGILNRHPSGCGHRAVTFLT